MQVFHGSTSRDMRKEDRQGATRSCNWSSVLLGALGANAGHTLRVAPPGVEKPGRLYTHQPGMPLLVGGVPGHMSCGCTVRSLKATGNPQTEECKVGSWKSVAGTAVGRVTWYRQGSSSIHGDH